MCSWCWGFAPEIESLAEELPVQVVVGGLRPGPMAHAIDDRMAETLAHHWVEIAEKTGQPFDTAFLDRRDGWLYDTEPSAIAVTTLRNHTPEASLAYFADVQRAFYSEGRDVTDFAVLTEIATEHGVEQDGFLEEIQTDDAKKRAWQDFSRSRNWGISGFPALIGEMEDGRLALLARGWTPADLIRQRIESLSETSVS